MKQYHLKNEKSDVFIIVQQVADIYARLLNQCECKNQTVFSASCYKHDEGDQVLDEIELNINLNISHNLRPSDTDNIEVRFQLENRKEKQETKDIDWRFDDVNSMAINFHETTELNGSSYTKTPFWYSTKLYNQNDSKFCFICSILAEFHPIVVSKTG